MTPFDCVSWSSAEEMGPIAVEEAGAAWTTTFGGRLGSMSLRADCFLL